MMRAIEAIIDEVGTVRLKERVHLRRSCRAIVTILDEEADLETALLSEASLAVDWDRPEEDEAWAHLQRLGNDPTFTFPAKEGGAFSEVRPVQGKGIAASHLLTRDRR
jgi:hypothetical protein